MNAASPTEWRVLDFFTLSMLAIVAFPRTRRWKIIVMALGIAAMVDVTHLLSSSAPSPYTRGANVIGVTLAALSMIIVAFRERLQKTTSRQPAPSPAQPATSQSMPKKTHLEYRLVRRPLPDGTSKIFAYKMPRR
jgi:uncharacterized membrane protein